MFTEDYLMRIINQVLAVLMTAIGLRKAGKYSEARQAVDQAIEQLSALPASIVELMEDEALLSTLTTNGQLDVGRLALLADLYLEQGEIFSRMGKQDEAFVTFARALRFILEVALFDDTNLSTENIGRIEGLVGRLKDHTLPVNTLLALSDYYQRMLEKDNQTLAAAGLSRDQVSRVLANFQDQINSLPTSTGD